jgi:hypothetical protein
MEGDMFDIKDDYLNDAHLIQLDKLICSSHFPWYFQESQTKGVDDGFFFSHILYNVDTPRSDYYNPVINIFENYLKYDSLCRITCNLVLRQNTPSISGWHTDFTNDIDELIEKFGWPTEDKITTAIFYLNTNNGCTEFEGGEKSDCIKNRFAIFPTNIPHRAIGQTDTNQRIVLNFNYINK